MGWGGGWWVGSYPLLSQGPTHVEVELGCDKKAGTGIVVKECIILILKAQIRIKHQGPAHNHVYSILGPIISSITKLT